MLQSGHHTQISKQNWSASFPASWSWVKVNSWGRNF